MDIDFKNLLIFDELFAFVLDTAHSIQKKIYCRYMFKAIGAIDPQGANFIVGRFLLVKRHSLVKKTNSEGGFGNVIVSLL